MSSVLFRGAGLRFVDIRKPKEGGPFVRLHLVSDFTEGIIDAMEWEEIPDCVSSAKLPGELPAQSLVLTPVDIALQQHELQLVLWHFHMLGEFHQSLKLEIACQLLGLKLEGAHDALADVRATVQVAKALAEQVPA